MVPSRAHNDSDAAAAVSSSTGLLGAVHDANQLLSVILGRAMQLLEDETVSSTQRPRLEAIAAAATDAAALLGGIMQGGTEKALASPASCDLALIARQSWEAAQAYLRATGGRADVYHCQLEVADDLIAAAPEPAIRQVVGNLLINALQAMPTGGHLWLRGRREQDRVCLTVQDDGPGMSAETLSRIFQPGFSQGKPMGHGIGLHRCQSTVTALGGQLDAQSSPGQGATFLLCLPAVAGDTETGVTAPLDLLVVDDEAALRELLTDVLEADGHRPTVCADAGRAQDLFQAGVFDLVLLDYGLPGLSGLELARVLRARDPAVILALVTGWGNESVASATEPGLIDLWATKPLDLTKIRRLVAAAAGLRRAGRS